jgi:hypothetical protein
VVQRLGARRLNHKGTRDIEERRARGMDRASQAQTSVAVRPKGISMFVASVLDRRAGAGIATPRSGAQFLPQSVAFLSKTRKSMFSRS